MTVLPTPVASIPADAAERAAALHVDQSFIVEAPAGSGKTGLLVQRLLKLLCRVDRPEAVLALTFTNKATAEMRERVLAALDLVPLDPATLSEFDRATRSIAADVLEQDRHYQWNLQANSHRLNVRTIDSLCGEIARSLPLSSGSVGQMPPAIDAAPLYHRAARAVTLRLGGNNAVLNDALRTVLLHRDADLHNCEELLSSMLATREQWARLIPLAADELTDAYLDEVVKPRLDRTLESIVCNHLHRLQDAFSPPMLHDLTQLASELAAADGYQGGQNPIAQCISLRTPPGTAVADAEHWALLGKLLLNNSSPHGWRRGFAVNHLRFALSRVQKERLKLLLESLYDDDALHALLLDLRNLPPAKMPDSDWRMAKALFHLLHFALLELQNIFQADGVCDFTERSLAAHAALRARPRLAADMGLQHLLVDEMQDTSSSQYELLEALTQSWDGTNQTVFLVGDPKQSIYLFRQARVEHFLHSLQTGRLAAVPLTVLRLTTNFRSARPLVEQFNQLFEAVFADPSSGSIGYTAAVAARSTQQGELHWHIDPLWGEHGQPSRRQSRRQVRREQADHLVQTVYHLRSGVERLPSMAVLVRSREHALRITDRLQEAGIPFRGVELESLAERPEVLDVLALTRALLHPADRVAWLAVLRAPWCGATLADLHHLAAGEDHGSHTAAPRLLFRERAAGLPSDVQPRVLRTLDALDAAVAAGGRVPLAELVERAARALGTERYQTERQRTNVRRYLELLESVEAELLPVEADDLESRLARLYAEPDTTPGAVDVMTIHKAKGLEWDVVFLPELQRTAAGNTQRLLDWLELPGSSAARADVLLAPIAPRGQKAAELGSYVRSARQRQEEAELARLFYVAVTRARSQLLLYAAPELKKDTGVMSVKPKTLLFAASLAVGAELQAEADQKRSEREATVTLLQAAADEEAAELRELADLRRVPDGEAPLPTQTPPAWRHGARHVPHSENLESVERPEGALASRNLGNAVHLFLDHLAARIAREPEATPQTLQLEIKSWHSRIRAVLRGSGSHGVTLERDTAAVLRALQNTVNSPAGWWLLHPHQNATSEQALTTDSGDTPLLRLDRSFVAGPAPCAVGTDTLWIVDYKTAVPGTRDLAAFLAGERERYAPQLRNYASRLAAQRSESQPIRLALFYPLVPVLDAWDWQP